MPSPSNEKSLSNDDRVRYGRHLVMPEIGEQGQQRLKNARVLIVGVGGLGSPAALYLAAAGVGTLGLVDADVVELSNLQRQVLFDSGSVGKSKLEVARRRLLDLNPSISVKCHNERLTSDNALEIIREYDIVIDGTDRFSSRYLVNDACVLLGKRNVYGSVFRFEGQVSVFDPARGPCYRCLYPQPPPPELAPNCADGGVLGVLPGIIGSLQASEALKLALGIGETLVGRVLILDALKTETRQLVLKKDPKCAVCSAQPTITSLIDYEEFCKGKTMTDPREISVEELKEKMTAGENVFLLDVRQPFEFEIANLGGTLIPLPELPTRMNELDPAAEIVVYCHTGARSGRAVAWLRKAGFSKAMNLAGGIEAWSVRIDNNVPRY